MVVSCDIRVTGDEEDHGPCCDLPKDAIIPVLISVGAEGGLEGESRDTLRAIVSRMHSERGMALLQEWRTLHPYGALTHGAKQGVRLVCFFRMQRGRCLTGKKV